MEEIPQQKPPPSPVVELIASASKKSSNAASVVVNPFGFLCEELSEFVNAYLTRKGSEDIEALEKAGGMPSLLKGLKTDAQEGLSSEVKNDFSDRERIFGSNQKIEAPMATWFELAIEAFEDLTMRILCVAGLVSLILGITTSDHPELAWIEGFAIFVAVMIVVCVTATNNYQKEKQFRALNAVRGNRDISVIRGKQKRVLSIYSIQVGDIVLLEVGDEIPADGILLHGSSLKVDESSMTGEGDMLHKNSLPECLEYLAANPIGPGSDPHHLSSPVMVSGTKIMEGTGQMVVISVGVHSQIGKAMSILSQEQDPTPLQCKLETIAEDVGKLGLTAATIIIVALYIRFAATHASGVTVDKSVATELIGYFIVGVTVLVVAIPEGLPLAVTVSLAYSVQQMMKDMNLVRRLQACETMGGATNICSDKTGTLTTNKMVVKNLWIGPEISNVFNFQKQAASSFNFAASFVDIFSLSVACNSTAFLERTVDVNGKTQINQVGSKTECALLLLLEDLGKNPAAVTEANPSVVSLPFSSSRKRMSSVIKLPTGGFRIFTKGASEIVLGLCSYTLDVDGHPSPLNETLKTDITNNVIEDFARGALRTVCIAYRDFDSAPADWLAKDSTGQYVVESNLICVCIAGIQDPVREEVPGAVKKCQTAGITVRMVTGDNITTAKAIAVECGIFHPDQGGLAIEGPEFMRQVGGVVCKTCDIAVCDCPLTSDAASKSGKPMRVDTIKNGKVFDELYPKLQVMARSRPEDKYALVAGLIERGEVVAVTGDGTNDAPALKKADVGFAMGIAGTEVAKEAADIILMDDNFSSIVVAIKWGRNVFDNIRRFLQFQLTVNVVAVFSAFVGALILQDSPLTAVQMLWVNLIMDTAASLALATQPPTDELLTRKPYKREDYIINADMWRMILGQSVYQIIIMFLFVFYGENFLPAYSSDTCFSDATKKFVCPGRRYTISGTLAYDKFVSGPSRHYTYVFNLFVMLQLFNEINCRKIEIDKFDVFEGMLSNLLFVYIWIVTFFIQVLMVQFGGYAMSCYSKGLTVEGWLICFAFGAGSLPWAVVLKLIPVPTSWLPQTGAGSASAPNPLDESGVLAMVRKSRRSSYSHTRLN